MAGIRRFGGLKFPRSHTPKFVWKWLKNFIPGEILRVTSTNFFGKDIPMFSRVKRRTCNPRKPGNLKRGGGRRFVPLHIDASSELQINNMMLLKLESLAKVEYYSVSKRLPLIHNRVHKSVHFPWLLHSLQIPCIHAKTIAGTQGRYWNLIVCVTRKLCDRRQRVLLTLHARCKF